MIRRGQRWLSLFVLAMLAFAQANDVVAGCRMDRGQLSQPQVSSAQHAICDKPGHCPMHGGMPMSAEDCLVRCSADLQAVGRLADTQAPIPLPVRYVHWNESAADKVALPVPPPRKSIPRRILLHSFLI